MSYMRRNDKVFRADSVEYEEFPPSIDGPRARIEARTRTAGVLSAASPIASPAAAAAITVRQKSSGSGRRRADARSSTVRTDSPWTYSIARK